MLTGGRIVVAAAGVVVLIIAAVLVVRSVWWDPTSKSTPFTPSSLSAGPSSTPLSGADAATPSTADSGGGDGGSGSGGGGDPGAGSGESGAGGTTTTTTTTSSGGSGGSSGGTTSSTVPYEATTTSVNKPLGSASANVTLPQVKGPDSAVVSAFNDGMMSALVAQASKAGSLKDRPGSGVRIGKDVLSGLLATSLTDGVGNSTALAGTVVVNIQDHSVITVASLFNDEASGLKRLVTESKKLGPEANAKFSGTNLQAVETTFQRWTAESAGMKVYFAQGLVAPSSEGVVELTIPWDSLSDVMNPSIAKVVAS
jgi:hypothetical protein